MVAEKFLQMIFVAAEITKFGCVFQGEFQWFQRVVKTHEANLAWNFTRGAQDGERICRSTEADIPDDKFAGMILQSLAQPELVDVKRLCFRDRPDDGMKCLGICERTHGTNAVVQADELIAGVGLHN